MSDVNQRLDARRVARDQESRIVASTLVGLNAAKPFIQFQTSMLRLWADNFELVARNYENGFEAFGVIERRTGDRQTSGSYLTPAGQDLAGVAFALEIGPLDGVLPGSARTISILTSSCGTSIASLSWQKR